MNGRNRRSASLRDPALPSESMANCAARSNSRLVAFKTAVFLAAHLELHAPLATL